MSRRSNHGSARQYPRTARLNELLREIIADELERMDDDRLHLVTITSVDIEGDLTVALSDDEGNCREEEAERMFGG